MVSSAETVARFKVYVSYCDTDFEFVAELVDGLKSDGRFNVAVAPDGLSTDSGWKNQVSDLIAEADAIVLVLSPDSAEAGKWELDCAREMSKQVHPIVFGRLHDVQIPDDLPAAKLIQFDDRQPRFDAAALRSLSASLLRNREWLQEHARLLCQARRWDAEGRPSHLLARGDDVVRAKIWALSRPDDAPTPTDMHVTFFCVSEAVDTAKHLALADQEEAETIALMQKAQAGAGLRRWARQAFALSGYALLVLALVSSSTYVVAKCTQPALQSSASFILPLKRAD